ncbi:MAG: GTP 3',8-cyclase MoaA [Verrucomicrobiota bacterium]|nr:GTP 3',8-cyclase MoaA [Verrucomicrobiota bacterium]
MKNASSYHLRLFLKSSCNFRCVYCNPTAVSEEGPILSDSEILDILSIAAESGVKRVHYSGGEPTLRKKLPEIIQHAVSLGFTEQVITTNGVLFNRFFDEYRDAGLTRANISIDSLDRQEFAKLTGRDELEAVVSAIHKSHQHLKVTKLNVVVMRRNLTQIPMLIELAAKLVGTVPRFIELQSNQPAFYQNVGDIEAEHVNQEDIHNRLRVFGTYSPAVGIGGENPNCQYFHYDEMPVTFGIIANHSRGYPCGGCHKLRVSPYGVLGVCIHAKGIDLKSTTLEEKRRAFKQAFSDREDLDIIQPDRKHHSATFGFWRWGDVSDKIGDAAEK